MWNDPIAPRGLTQSWTVASQEGSTVSFFVFFILSIRNMTLSYDHSRSYCEQLWLFFAEELDQHRLLDRLASWRRSCLIYYSNNIVLNITLLIYFYNLEADNVRVVFRRLGLPSQFYVSSIFYVSIALMVNSMFVSFFFFHSLELNCWLSIVWK